MAVETGPDEQFEVIFLGNPFRAMSVVAGGEADDFQSDAPGPRVARECHALHEESKRFASENRKQCD